MRRVTLLGVVVMILSVVPVAPALASTTPAAPPSPSSHRACSAPAGLGEAACLALVRDDIQAQIASSSPPGYSPSDLQAAYATAGSTGGAGLTVGVVDAFDLPTAESDLGTYRAQYGLPPCTTANGCFRKVNQSGGTTLPPADAGWGQEIALDLDMVSAACPNCSILLVEASSTRLTDLGTAVNTAVRLGANAVSNSYGGPESTADPTFDSSYYNHPGVVVTVSSGDSGYGALYPAASQYVTAVGGTSLSRATTPRGWAESAWRGAGSGCSAYDAKPSWQSTTGCANRAIADVSAVADPNTGVAVYDSTPNGTQQGWQVFGGTSAAAPIIAGVSLLAGAPAAGTYPASYPWARAAALNDVTTGSNGTCPTPRWCNATPGWDGPTGLGTPNGPAAFAAPGAVPPPPPPSSTDLNALLWQVRNTASPGAPDASTVYGSASATALSCDFNGDGRADVAVYDHGHWDIRSQFAGGASGISFDYGWSTGTPVCGKWNGGTSAGIGVYENGTWYLKDIPGPGPADRIINYGFPGALPVVGDWDGNGTDTIGVYSPPDALWMLRNSNTPGNADAGVFNYGWSTATPVVGHFNGPGPSGIGIFDNGAWLLRNNPTPGGPQRTINYGGTGYLPVTGDYSGSGTTGIGVITKTHY